MKRFICIFIVSVLICSGVIYTGKADSASQPGRSNEPLFSITGTVNNPIQLTLSSLEQMQSTEIKMNEVSSDGNYHGVFVYKAVPLRTLLNMADIEQKSSTFNKLVDATIVLRDAGGNKVALSWGEVYYHNPAEITVAYSSTPVYPQKHNCTKCHVPEDYIDAIEQLERKVAMPKLLINGDFYSDRFIEGITNIDVVDLRPNIPVDQDARLRSNRIQVRGEVRQPLIITNLSDYPEIKVTKKVVGVGRGYHGLHTFRGTSIKSVLNAAGVEPRMDQVVMISAPDGYRSSFSMGELLISDRGDEIILADTVDGKPLVDGGNIRVMVGPDNTDDRDVQAVTNIEVIEL